jgi:very-short-patch-repair endonuclease
MPTDRVTEAARWSTELADLLDRQSGVASRRQLAGIGYSSDRIAGQVRARRWRIVGPAVVTHRGPLTFEQRCWVAVLALGPRSALCGRTALEWAGLKGWADGEVHVVVPRGAYIRTWPGVTVHESRRYDPAVDRERSAGPPRTPVPRSAIDAAAWTPSLRAACGLLAAVVQQRIASPERLARALDRVGRVRHCRAMRLAISDISGGAQALSEIDAVHVLRVAFPDAVVRQQVRVESSGRRRYLDLEIEFADGRRLAIEIDGGLHLAPLRWWDDQRRHNDVVIAGRAVLRFPTVVVRHQPYEMVAQVRAWERSTRRTAA